MCSAQSTVLRFFKTLMVQHGMTKGARFCIILVVHINHFEEFLQ